MVEQLGQVTPEQQLTLMHWLLNQGPWAVISVGMLYLIYRAGGKVFTHVVIPLKDHAVDHLKGVTSSMNKLSDCLECVQTKLSQVDEKTTVIMEECRGFVSESKHESDKIHERLDNIEERINKLPMPPLP